MFCARTTPGIASFSSTASSRRSKLYCQPRTLVPFPVESRLDHVTSMQRINRNFNKEVVDQSNGDGSWRWGEGEEEEEPVSGIQVSRQKYIPVPKPELLNAIKETLFDSGDDDADSFLLLASCLESILHAEHKSILERMRADYNSTQTMDGMEEFYKGSQASSSDPSSYASAVIGERSSTVADEKDAESRSIAAYEALQPPPFAEKLDLWNLLAFSSKDSKRRSRKRVGVANRFQQDCMQLLRDAQFEELSAADLALTSALNTDYLLTLPIYVDWKRAAKSNAIIFRRGYTTERQKGLLIVEKLDYLQSRLLRGIFSTISKPSRNFGAWIKEALSEVSQTKETQYWMEKVRLWLKELSYQLSNIDIQQKSDDLVEVDQLSDSELPIWLAAQRAVSRYEGILSPVGPRQKLLRKLLSWIGLIAPVRETPSQLENHNNVLEPYLRPIFLSRITLSDIWQPASKKLCGNDVWKRLKSSLSILLSPSTLQEPAFQELILLYTKDDDQITSEDKFGTQALQLKIYERIPIPDLAVVFPHKKLYFRIIDTVRLDVATILGLLAFLINYKFEDILLSPSAIFLDVVAVTALIIYVIRVALGYKQTWDRYQLLVNKTLYEKTLASGFGSVHFLLDASEEQQYKEAILIYAILLKTAKTQNASAQDVQDKCERFLYRSFKAKVEVPVEKGLSTLVRLGLVAETPSYGYTRLRVVSCPEAYNALRARWNGLLG